MNIPEFLLGIIVTFAFEGVAIIIFSFLKGFRDKNDKN